MSGTWAITGEKKADGLDAPKRPLFRGGVGAVEVAGAHRDGSRSTALRRRRREPSTSPRADVILGNSDRVLTFGVNWYLNRWVKVQFNVIRRRRSRTPHRARAVSSRRSGAASCGSSSRSEESR